MPSWKPSVVSEMSRTPCTYVAFAQTDMHAYIHKYTHAYMHAHTHTHIHTQTGLLEEQDAVLEPTTRVRPRSNTPSRRLRFSADDLRLLLIEQGLPIEVVRKAVRIAPALRHLGHVGGLLQWNLVDNLRFLQDEVGLSENELAACISKYPIVLIHNIQAMRVNIRFFRHIVCLSRDQTRELVRVQPGVLGTSAVYKLLPTLAFLLCDLRVSLAESRYILIHKPQLLTYSLDKNIRPKIAFFRTVVGASADEVRRLVVRDPAILGYSLEQRLKPRLEYLRENFPQFLRNVQEEARLMEDILLATGASAEKKMDRHLSLGEIKAELAMRGFKGADVRGKKSLLLRRLHRSLMALDAGGGNGHADVRVDCAAHRHRPCGESAGAGVAVQATGSLPQKRRRRGVKDEMKPVGEESGGGRGERAGGGGEDTWRPMVIAAICKTSDEAFDRRFAGWVAWQRKRASGRSSLSSNEFSLQ